MRILVAMAAAALLAQTDASYLQDLEKWRAGYEAKLKAPDGWLSVAGLFWLHEGVNVTGSDPQSDIVLAEGTPKRAGVFRFEGGKAIWEPVSGAAVSLKSDEPGPPDVVRIGDVAMTVIVRGGKTGVRLRDPNAATRLHFTGSKWFPADESFRVTAKWVAYPEPAIGMPAKTIAITNVLGMTDQEPAPGYAEFSLNGRKLRLEPVTEDDHLFFMFKDSTAGKTTYGSGRFLYAAMLRIRPVRLRRSRRARCHRSRICFRSRSGPGKRNTIDAGSRVPVAAPRRVAGGGRLRVQHTHCRHR